MILDDAISKKDVQAQLWELYMKGSKHIIAESWQDKPWTATKVTVRHPGWSVHTAYGFAKVQYPDVWDAGYGEWLCIRKALAKIAKHLADSVGHLASG